jgi:hypothetical protein
MKFIKLFKQCLTLVLLLQLIISCSDSQVTTYPADADNVSEIANDEIQNYAVPNDSKSWNPQFFEVENADFIFNTYRNEKTLYRDQLFYQNLLTMWHVNFVDIHKDLNMNQVESILDDMDGMKFNVASFETYYVLVNYHYSLNHVDRKKRLTAFYKKNHDYLTKAKWSKSDLQETKLKKLEQLNFVNL